MRERSKLMKKYTDTELLETLLPMLNYSISISSRENVVSVLDMVNFEILENSGRNVDKDFVVALQNRIDKLAKKTRVEATNVIFDKDGNIECNNDCCGDCEEATYSSKEYHELKTECIEKDHEIYKLRRTVEALEYLIYNCIPKDDRRAG